MDDIEEENEDEEENDKTPEASSKAVPPEIAKYPLVKPETHAINYNLY